MNTVILKGAAEHGGPIALSAGVAALTVALVSSGGHGHLTAAARPGPTVTATVTAPPAAPTPGPARTTVVAHPSARHAPAATVAAVSDHRPAMPHTGGGMSIAQTRPPSFPTPSPAAAPCSGQVLTVRLLHAACVSVGGG